MPSYYPVYLDLKGRRCVVVGGGSEAERKAQGLLEGGAQVTVISPQVTIVLTDLASRGLIHWESREYEMGDLEVAFLAIAENDNPKVYGEVAREAERRGVLLNVVDMTHLCMLYRTSRSAARRSYLRHLYLWAQPCPGTAAARGAEREPRTAMGGHGRHAVRGAPSAAQEGASVRTRNGGRSAWTKIC